MLNAFFFKKKLFSLKRNVTLHYVGGTLFRYVHVFHVSFSSDAFNLCQTKNFELCCDDFLTQNEVFQAAGRRETSCLVE